jgi:hypothetical protein
MPADRTHLTEDTSHDSLPPKLFAAFTILRNRYRATAEEVTALAIFFNQTQQLHAHGLIKEGSMKVFRLEVLYQCLKAQDLLAG